MDNADLTPAERRVCEVFPKGEVADFRGGGEEAAEDGSGWGAERTVRADVLRRLLLGGTSAEGRIAGLRIRGARISGLLDVRFGTVDRAVSLRDCHFESAPVLHGAQLRQFNLSTSWLPGLSAAAVRVDGLLRMTGCRFTGPVQLGGARISGAVFLDRARLGTPPGDGDGDGSGDGEPGREALRLNHADINGDLWAPELTADGRISLDGASIGGMVNLDGARLSAPGDTSLQATALTVGSHFDAMRLHSRGRVNLRSATVPGQLNLAQAHLSNPAGVALRASGVSGGELWLRDAAPIEGSVDLRRAAFRLLHVSPDVWPEHVRIDELSYTSLAPPRPAVERLPLLERDEDGYLPFAYEQLTAAYRRIGDDAAARDVQLAKQRRHRTTLPLYARIWGHLQDATVGYGFRPMRAAGWLVTLLLFGTLAYGLHHPSPLHPTESPPFNPLAYTLDLLLPVVDFGQAGAYAPRGGYQWLSYGLILSGWVLATTFAAGVTRSLSRQ